MTPALLNRLFDFVLGFATALACIAVWITWNCYELIPPEKPTWNEQESVSDIAHRDAGRAYETTLGTRSK